MKALLKISVLAVTIIFLMVAISLGQDAVKQSGTKGVEYATHGKFKEAKEEFKKVLNAYPSGESAKEFLKVIEDVAEVKVLSRTAIPISKGLASYYKNQCDQAISYFNAAMEIEPNYAPAYYYRANAHICKHDLLEGHKDYSKAIELDPRYTKAYSRRGYITMEFGAAPNKAVSDFSKVIELEPRNADAYYDRGRVYSGSLLHQYDRAISDFTKAIEIDPMHSGAYGYRAIAYFHKEEYGRAWEDVHKFQDLGHKINPKFLRMLRLASGRQE